MANHGASSVRWTKSGAKREVSSFMWEILVFFCHSQRVRQTFANNTNLKQVPDALYFGSIARNLWKIHSSLVGNGRFLITCKF